MSNDKLNNGRFLRINEVFAFVAIHPDGSEDIIAFSEPGVGQFPLIGADFELIDIIIPILSKRCKNKRYEVRVYSLNRGTHEEKESITSRN